MADAAAIRALEKGEATPDQQQRALRWIIEQAARTYQPTYFPDNPRDSDFAQGRRHVGLQLVTILSLSQQQLEKL